MRRSHLKAALVCKLCCGPAKLRRVQLWLTSPHATEQGVCLGGEGLPPELQRIPETTAISASSDGELTARAICQARWTARREQRAAAAAVMPCRLVTRV